MVCYLTSGSLQNFMTSDTYLIMYELCVTGRLTTLLFRILEQHLSFSAGGISPEKAASVFIRLGQGPEKYHAIKS